jgi:hypothetical protein
MLIYDAQDKYHKDPRLSPQQKRVLGECRKADPNAEILGLDRRMRPVVRVKTGIPQQPRIWAVLRNGDPADVTWEDKHGYTEGTYAFQNLAEPWSKPVQKKTARKFS